MCFSRCQGCVKQIFLSCKILYANCCEIGSNNTIANVLSWIPFISFLTSIASGFVRILLHAIFYFYDCMRVLPFTTFVPHSHTIKSFEFYFWYKLIFLQSFVCRRKQNQIFKDIIHTAKWDNKGRELFLFVLS